MKRRRPRDRRRIFVGIVEARREAERESGCLTLIAGAQEVFACVFTGSLACERAGLFVEGEAFLSAPSSTTLRGLGDALPRAKAIAQRFVDLHGMSNAALGEFRRAMRQSRRERRWTSEPMPLVDAIVERLRRLDLPYQAIAAVRDPGVYSANLRLDTCYFNAEPPPPATYVPMLHLPDVAVAETYRTMPAPGPVWEA